jgi:hypothetical protein
MRITDGKRTVNIEMKRWNGSGFDPDFSLDFFEAGGLPYNEETDTYTVKDVDYCIDMGLEATNLDVYCLVFEIKGE